VPNLSGISSSCIALKLLPISLLSSIPSRASCSIGEHDLIYSQSLCPANGPTSQRHREKLRRSCVHQDHIYLNRLCCIVTIDDYLSSLIDRVLSLYTRDDPPSSTKYDQQAPLSCKNWSLWQVQLKESVGLWVLSCIIAAKSWSIYSAQQSDTTTSSVEPHDIVFFIVSRSRNNKQAHETRGTRRRQGYELTCLRLSTPAHRRARRRCSRLPSISLPPCPESAAQLAGYRSSTNWRSHSTFQCVECSVSASHRSPILDSSL